MGPVLILAGTQCLALPSAPLRVSRSATALEQGRGHDRLACVFILHPPRESGTRDARALVARATSCDHSCHFSHLYSYCSSVQASFDAMLPAGGWPAQTCSARRAAALLISFFCAMHFHRKLLQNNSPRTSPSRAARITRDPSRRPRLGARRARALRGGCGRRDEDEEKATPLDLSLAPSTLAATITTLAATIASRACAPPASGAE